MVKKNKKEAIIRVFGLLLIFIVIIIMYNLINNLQTLRIPKESNLYQYVMGKKVTYNGILEMSSKDNVTKLTTENGEILLETEPIYYSDERNKAILPAQMMIIFPMNNGVLNKLPSLTTLYVKYGDTYVKNEEFDKKIEEAFLFDANDLYVFIGNTILTVNGTEYKLPPLSYVNATYEGYVEIYNYDTEEYIYIEETNEDVIAETSNYKINLSNDSIQYEDVEQLLLKKFKNIPSFK